MATQQREREKQSGGAASSMLDTTKDAASKTGDAIKDAASKTGDAIKDAASKTGEAVKDAASNVAHKAADAGTYVAHKAADAGSYVAHKAEDATAAVGSGMESLAGTIREKGPHDGMLGNASSAVANTLESFGHDLQEHGLSGIADDITNTIRKHPVPSLLVGIGLGFLLARVFSK